MINRHDVLAMCDFIDQKGLDEAVLSELRAQYEGRHFTWCLEDDVCSPVQPYLERETYNVYLVNSSDHCSTLTRDESGASGVVFAECLPE